MELEVPKRSIFKPTLIIVMVQHVLQWERQKRFSRCKCQGIMQRERERERAPNIFICTRKEGKKKGRRSNNEENSQNCHFGHISRKIAYPLFGAWSLLLVHVRFAPRHGSQKAYKMHFLETRRWKCNHGKNALRHETNSWSMDANNPLVLHIAWTPSMLKYDDIPIYEMMIRS